MRRAFAILLLCVLGLPLFTSAPGLGRRTQLPICCRRAGLHHCIEMALPATTPTTPAAFRMTCPAFPRPAAQAHPGVWSFDGASATAASLSVQPASVGQVEAGYRISFNRARQKRGPPAQIS